jgi:hypothetical protein
MNPDLFSIANIAAQIAAAISGVISAAYWGLSATARVKPGEGRNPPEVLVRFTDKDNVGEYDVFETMRKQTKLNGVAARWAAAAAGAVAISTTLTLLTKATGL